MGAKDFVPVPVNVPVIHTARPNYQLSILNYQLNKGLYVEKTLCRKYELCAKDFVPVPVNVPVLPSARPNYQLSIINYQLSIKKNGSSSAEPLPLL